MVGAAFLGAVLVVASIGKVLQPVLFVEQIRHEGLEILFSAETVALIALALETALGIALLLGVRHRYVLVLSTLLVAFFVFLTGRNYYWVLTGVRDSGYDCGCFGVFMQRTATEAFWQDLLLLIPALVLAYLDPSARRLKPPAWKSGLIAVGTAVVVIWGAVGIGRPGFRPETTALSAEGGPVFVPTQQFRVEIDNLVDGAAQVLECELTLQFLIVSEKLPKVLLLDATTQNVYEVDLAPQSLQAAESFLLPPEVPLTRMTGFEVTDRGVTWSYAGHIVRLQDQP